MATYENIFARRNPHMDAYFHTDAEPIEYRGYQLFNRIPGAVCDIVKDGVCVSQYVTVRAAKAYIDNQQ